MQIKVARERKSSASQRVGRVHPQIAWAKLRVMREAVENR
jgi:hypothetical protein